MSVKTVCRECGAKLTTSQCATGKCPFCEAPVPMGNDVWVLKTEILWRREHKNLPSEMVEPSLLSQALTPFYLGGNISPGQALTFFEKAEPDYSMKRMSDAIRQLSIAGHQNPELAVFLGELDAALTKSN